MSVVFYELFWWQLEDLKLYFNDNILYFNLIKDAIKFYSKCFHFIGNACRDYIKN